MRADLAAALLHDPKILYLDEPTIGLDISVKDRVRAFIRELVAESGTTVMLTTHDLGDIEDICKRIVIIDEGRIIYDGDLQAVKDTFARERSMHFFARGRGRPGCDPRAARRASRSSPARRRRSSRCASTASTRPPATSSAR